MASLLPRFERVDTVYKTLDGTPFTAAVLVSRTLKSGQKTCPLLVHFHGGGLYMGTILEPFFLSRWFCLKYPAQSLLSKPDTNALDRPLELAEAESAIVVSPAYRLLPEATGSDILDDIKDFWEWVRGSLPTYVAEKWPGVTLDLDRTAVFGESAGGYLSLQSAFLFPPPSSQIKVAMAQYPAIYPDIAEWNPRPAEVLPEADALVDAYMAQINPGTIRLSSPFPALADLGLAMNQTGRHREWLGNDERLTLDYCLRTAEKVPPLWVMQGIDDQRVSLTFGGEGYGHEKH
jgi:acetyl esterase/lipase